MIIDPKSKVKKIAELQQLAEAARTAGKRVVFGNGCFDLLHVGHVRYLQSAKALGDILIVGINSDASVRALKGKGRPLQTQDERAEIVGSLGCVDYVMVFDSPTVEGVLLDLRPDIHAKGTDYSRETVPERDAVRSYSGRIAIVGDPKDHSSRDLIAKIVAALCG